jgi:hypothetical protein
MATPRPVGPVKPVYHQPRQRYTVVAFTGQSVSESKKPFQHPSGDPDNNLGARGAAQTSLPCSGPCLDALANVSAAINRNTKMMELVVSHIVHGKHGATSTQSSGVQDSIHDSDDETMLVTRRSTRMFRARARPTVHKDANELQYRVSLISTNNACCLKLLQDNVRKHANRMMGRTRNDKIEPAPEEAVLKYKHTGKDEDGPSMDPFRADFSERHPGDSPWNIRLAEIFLNDYTQKGHPFRNLKEVSDYFFTYLQSLQRTHRKMATTAPSGTGTVHEEHSRRNRIHQRKKTVRALSPLRFNHADTFDQITSGSNIN